MLDIGACPRTGQLFIISAVLPRITTVHTTKARGECHIYIYLFTRIFFHPALSYVRGVLF